MLEYLDDDIIILKSRLHGITKRLKELETQETNAQGKEKEKIIKKMQEYSSVRKSLLRKLRSTLFALQINMDAYAYVFYTTDNNIPKVCLDAYENTDR